MPRIRSIKPGFFRSEDVSVLPLRARLTWIGIWTQCDDQGRTKDSVKLIKADVWPLDDVSLRDIEEDLAVLAAARRIVRYEVNGEKYLEVANWSEHQKINRPTESKIPPPNGSYPQADAHGAITERSPQEGKGKEGKGGDAREPRERSPTPDKPPSPKCPEHQNQRRPPACGQCADARKALAEWEAERNSRQRDMPDCQLHRGQLAHNCAGCRADQIAADA